MATNIPEPIFGPNGFVEPSPTAVLNGALADIVSAFNSNPNPSFKSAALNTQLMTPQGQLASSFAAVLNAVFDMFLFYTTQTDPAFAVGRMQDAIGRIYFIERIGATYTTVSCLCNGAVGVVIPTGALAQDTSGNTYQCTLGGTIGSRGNITLNFANLNVGPIPCPIGTLTIIYQAIPGWDTITNAAPGTIGQAVETRSAFEARRQASVAQNSIGTLASIQGAVLQVPGVTDCYVIDNKTSSPLTIGDYTLLPNSVYVAVIGGSQTAIAQAIWSKSSPRCAYNGNTIVPITNPIPNTSLPPYYVVTYEIPTTLPIIFSITLAANQFIPSNAVALVANAVSNQPCVFTGSISGDTLTVTGVSSGALAIGQQLSDSGSVIVAGTEIVNFGSGSGGVGTYALSNIETVSSESILAVYPAPITHIGNSIFASQYYSTILSLGSWAQIISAYVGSPNASACRFTGAVSGTTLTVSAVTSGALSVGQTLTDTTGNLVPGTIIIGLGTGRGGIGTYTLNISQTVSIEAMAAVTANLFEVAVGIDQSPIVYAANVQVAFV